MFQKRKNEDATEEPDFRKIVVVGSERCGKTSLSFTFINGTFPQTYTPSCNEVTHTTLLLQPENTSVKLGLWDTYSDYHFERLRPLAYPGASVMLLCFSVEDRSSFERVVDEWWPEVHHCAYGAPMILVGLKSDMRDVEVQREVKASTGGWQDMVSIHEAKELAKRIGAKHYLECSAMTGEGVTELFDYVARVALAVKKPASGRKKESRLKGCVIT